MDAQRSDDVTDIAEGIPEQPEIAENQEQHEHADETPVDLRTAITRIKTRLLESEKEANTYQALLGELDSYLNDLGIFEIKDRQFLRDYLADFVAERNLRAMDIETPVMTEAVEAANDCFPFPPYAYLCIDGRVTLTHVFGIMAKMKGGAIEIPAADPREFVPAMKGGLVLRKDSNTARKMGFAFEHHDEISEILDSHLSCAAQGVKMSSIGRSTPDAGLLEDVKRKAEIAKAMEKYTRKHHPGKTVHPIQISFDPHNGYAYMGLEGKKALETAGKVNGFSDEVLQQLAAEGSIVSTREIAQDPRVRPKFLAAYESFKPKFDWKDHYAETANQFWTTLHRLKSEILPIIIEKLTAENGPYAGMNRDNKSMEQRAMLILSNAFSGFCNNNGKGYQYGHHTESSVSVSERDFRPCHYSAFVVYSEDLEDLAHRVTFAAGIVRKSRLGGAVPLDANYASAEEFAAAPVAVLVKEIVRDELQQTELAKLRQIDWSFLEGIDWIVLSDTDFLQLLARRNKSVELALSTGLSLNRLRKKMAALYDHTKHSAEQLINGNLFAVPVITDLNRRFKVIIPFFLKGFKEA
jgi:hypothetical protein